MVVQILHYHPKHLYHTECAVVCFLSEKALGTIPFYVEVLNRARRSIRQDSCIRINPDSGALKAKKVEQ